MKLIVHSPAAPLELSASAAATTPPRVEVGPGPKRLCLGAPQKKRPKDRKAAMWPLSMTKLAPPSCLVEPGISRASKRSVERWIWASSSCLRRRLAIWVRCMSYQTPAAVGMSGSETNG